MQSENYIVGASMYVSANAERFVLGCNKLIFASTSTLLLVARCSSKWDRVEERWATRTRVGRKVDIRCLDRCKSAFVGLQDVFRLHHLFFRLHHFGSNVCKLP